MTDVHFARQLQAFAQHAVDTAAGGMRRKVEPQTVLAALLLSETLHMVLLGFASLHEALEDDLDDIRQSLSSISRALGKAGIKRFEPYETELIALLDLIHTKPVSRVLLPETFTQDIFRETHGFVDRLACELYERIETESRSTQ